MEKNKERIAFLKKRLEMYYEAEEKILQGQSYTIGSRTLTRTSLANVQSKIKELERVRFLHWRQEEIAKGEASELCHLDRRSYV